MRLLRRPRRDAGRDAVIPDVTDPERVLVGVDDSAGAADNRASPAGCGLLTDRSGAIGLRVTLSSLKWPTSPS